MNKEQRHARKVAKRSHKRKVNYEQTQKHEKLVSQRRKTKQTIAYKYERFVERVRRENEKKKVSNVPVA